MSRGKYCAATPRPSTHRPRLSTAPRAALRRGLPWRQDAARRLPPGSGTAYAAGETHIFKQDGHWLRVTFQPQLDAAGRFAGGVHIVSDVTELKQVEQELQSSVSQLQSSSSR